MIDVTVTENAPETQPATISTLEELYALRDLITMDRDAKRKQIIPEDVQADLDAIELEYAGKFSTLNDKIEKLEVFLKALAVENGEKIDGSHFYVQFTKGGYSASAKDVFDLANRWEKTSPEFAAELRSILTVKKSSACIKPK